MELKDLKQQIWELEDYIEQQQSKNEDTCKEEKSLKKLYKLLKAKGLYDAQ
jgi:cell division protein FtsL